MIKFRCPHCTQKLGVPDEYANKRVRCSKCHEPCRVPQPVSRPAPQPAPQPVGMDGLDMMEESPPPQTQPSRPVEPVRRTAPAQTPPPNPTEQSDQFAGLNLEEAESGPDLNAMAAIRNARNKQRTKASSKLAKSSRKSARDTDELGVAAGLAIGAGKIPLAMGVSLVFGIAVCIAWTILASLTGFIFVYVAVGVAAASAYGLVMFTGQRNAGLGVGAIFMALICIFIGKFMIGKWAIMPMFQDDFNSVFEEGYEEDTYSFSDMTTEEQQELIYDQMQIYNIGVMELWGQEEIDEPAAKELISTQYKNLFAEEELAAEGYEAEDQAVYDQIETWTNDDIKIAMFNEHYDRYEACCLDWLMDSNLVQGIGLFIAFLSAFSFWDLFILPISCVTAYKIGSGGD